MTRLLLSLALFVSPVAVRAADPAALEHFEKHVRPVLVEKCLSCHGEKAKGDLRLDTRAAVLKGGERGPAVVPGKPKEGLLLKGLTHTDEDLKMPPAGKLPEREIAALTKWIELGAPWPDKVTLASPNTIDKAAAKHWAFQPVKRPEPPRNRDPKGSAHPIDQFVVARLAEKQLTLSPRADKRTLIRRATFDLHGLPPTPAEVEAFVKDAAPDAYDKLLDRLLASPRYGERWGRYWLDIARYADNKGYVFFEGKEYPWAWTYRDYVIKSLNDDKPFDRFVTEQLAADLLAPNDGDKQAALGFLTVGGHFMNNTHDIIDDRMDVVTRGLMGLTVTCARCHDHKFDPIPAADYYSLYGILRSATEPTVAPVVGTPPSGWSALAYSVELHRREKALIDFVTAKHTALVTGARTRVAEYLLAAHAARNQPPADDFMLIADPGDLNPTMVTRWRQFLSDTKKRKHPAFRHWHAFADLKAPADFDNSADVLKGIVGANRLVVGAFTKPPRSMHDVADVYAKLLARVDQEWRDAAKSGLAGAPDPDAVELRAVLYGPDAPADAPLALDWGFLSLFPDRATQGEYQNHIRALELWLVKGPPRAMALHDSARPYDPRVFERGHPGRPGDPVPRQMPKIAAPARKPFASAGSGRLELAREIVSKDNPLTARVFVNRVWMHHFGKALVGTPGDFGLRGDTPTHPELLDWLASEFVAKGWSVKALHKLIMTSATYTQSSADRADAVAIDSENRLLWKQNRRRLDFEALHDATLAVGGQLSTDLGGPAVRLFGANTRRAVYGYVDRLEFPSLLTTFDVPNPAGLSPERTSTTVAPQALFLMNGPFARAAAKQLIAQPAMQKLSDSDRLDLLYLTVYGRKPDADEKKLALTFVAKGADRWADLAHALLMTNEFAFVD